MIKMKKVLSIVMTISILLVMMMPVVCHGFTSYDPTPTPPSGLENRANKILGAIQWVAYAIATGMIVYIGVKYTMTSANERADVKQSAIYFMIGAIVIAASPKLFEVLYDFFEGAH